VFTDESVAGTAPITSWAWTFGDGGTSIEQNPSHTYTTPGAFDVVLTVTTGDGANTRTRSGYIVVTLTPNGPVADFTAGSTSGAHDLAVQFGDLSLAGTKPITSWAWNFGDGNTGTVQSPSHTYTTAGTFTVTLMVTTEIGSNTMTKTGYITVSDPVPPTAEFAASPAGGLVPLTVLFADLSTDGSSPITGWVWDFGDGGTSTVKSPVHTYNAPGTYTVSLSVATAAGSNLNTKAGFISVGTPVGPTAAFSASPTSGLKSLAVLFADRSIPGSAPITNWFWEFGDGTTSSQQSPAHIFSVAGTYGVTLTVTTAIGTSQDAKPGLVVVVEPVAATADFSASPVTGTKELLVQFADASAPGTSPITAWSWSFGDGNISSSRNPSHLYANAGAFDVTFS
jgi:tripartite motif-containing protein 71